jgi:hypothetical protein
MIFFLINYFLLPFVILGYGLLSQQILLDKTSRFNELGLIGFFGLLFLYFLSSIFHFFTNINSFIIYSVILVGFISFTMFFIQKKIDTKQLIFLLLVLIIFLPISIIADPNEDFFLYCFPYIKYLESSKIIFGITNLNDFLAYSTNSLYNIIIFLKLPIIENQSYAVPILYFYIFFIIYLTSQLIKRQNILYLFILSLSLITFAKLRDLGTSIPPQLLLLIVGCLIYEIINNNYEEKKITAILFLSLFAIILRFNSIIVLPIIIIFFIFNIRKFFFYINKNKIIIFFLLLVSLIFISKNLIQSGCLIYPTPQLCFSNLDWSSENKIVEGKYNKLQADAKGWAFYAKEKFDIKKKFVWKNLIDENFVGYNDYASASPIFWFKYWIKDPQYKKIINLALITLLIFILAIINLKKEKVKINHYKKNLILLIFSFFSILIWFLLSPQLRYGGFFCFIYFFSLLFTNLFSVKYRKIKNANTVLILLLSLLYLEVKNITRINYDLEIANFDNFPWPNYPKLIINEDYIRAEDQNLVFNKRIYSNNLVFDNSDEYILMCGNIDFPCISEGKEVCLGNKEVRNYYSFFLKKEDNKSCRTFMNKNILY